MWQFMTSRQSVGDLNDDILTEIETCIINPPIKHKEEFQEKIENAFNDIRKTYEKFNKQGMVKG